MAAKDRRGHGSADKDPGRAQLAAHIRRAGLPPDPRPIAARVGRVARRLLARRTRGGSS